VKSQSIVVIQSEYSYCRFPGPLVATRPPLRMAALPGSPSLLKWYIFVDTGKR